MISASLGGATASRLTPAALAASAYMLRRWWTDWERLAGLRGRFITTPWKRTPLSVNWYPRSTVVTIKRCCNHKVSNRPFGEAPDSAHLLGMPFIGCGVKFTSGQVEWQILR